MKKINIL